jgi:hypothetical protein
MFQSNEIEFNNDHSHHHAKHAVEEKEMPAKDISPLKTFKEKSKWVASPKLGRV